MYKMEEETWSIEDFQVGKQLGKGKFGQVHLARHQPKGTRYAVKTMDFAEHHAPKRVQALVQAEIANHTKVTHPNVITLHGVMQVEECIYHLVLEYASGGDLFHELKRHGKYAPDSEDKPRVWMKQIGAALEFCHGHHVIHRDVKIDNFFLCAPDQVKLGDFGYSVHHPPGSELRSDLCGTLDYISPEIAKNVGHDHRVDIWAFGIALYELLEGRPPFMSPTYNETYRKIASGKFSFSTSPTGEGGPSLLARDLITKILVVLADDRPGWPEILSHEFWQ